MIGSKSLKNRATDLVLAVFLTLLATVMLYPMLYEVFVSFSEAGELVKSRGILLHPLGFTLDAYKIVFGIRDILTGYANTLFVMVFGLAVNLLMTSLGAYFLSRKADRVKLQKPIMLLILFTMYFSGGLVPSWLTVRNLGLYDTRWALILPTAVNTYNMILLTSYFRSIPESLEESVRMDGGGHFTILFRIVLPLSKPAMAVMFLYYGVSHWNSWFNAMIYLRDNSLYPLQLILRNILVEGSALNTNSFSVSAMNYEEMEKSVKAAMVVVSTIPFLLIYPFLQKYFRGGLMVGSLKE
ncbi:carbohydrate ABC transporter permease [Acetatifactor muris]|jgi:putative aldouronate transport system permease protein|uniref:Inner membrane ABC transporter permease protein YcjP n=1 Tax=Acetatifactor muris TaxID=879566 RepID=A0A2K4ZGE0_9FIRM|nr:carbohydrate ABC transporter permease [Acetatifactor muris]MCI8800829.1 carbohydrate ABC transporter permease [Lachnospiraceae bacterium]MCR2045796.1 carbohydrate ABC transporter permease [Acetatifactor muris]SOY29533.1 Inner membrane ABC transporter permease protein YcjP [Acetatifactor muris]